LTDLRPARQRIGVTLRPRTGLGLAALAAAVLMLVWMHGTEPPPALNTHEVATTDIAVLNPGTVAVTVHVTNDGTTTVTPTCLVNATDASGRYHGSGVFTVRDPIPPGRTTSFTARLPITGLGAQSVTHASSVCQ
jgi:hypothetical protein